VCDGCLNTRICCPPKCRQAGDGDQGEQRELLGKKAYYQRLGEEGRAEDERWVKLMWRPGVLVYQSFNYLHVHFSIHFTFSPFILLLDNFSFVTYAFPACARPQIIYRNPNKLVGYHSSLNLSI
jgi:hypothetical protein